MCMNNKFPINKSLAFYHKYRLIPAALLGVKLNRAALLIYIIRADVAVATVMGQTTGP